MLINSDLFLKEAEENLNLAHDLINRNHRWAYFIAHNSVELSLKAVLIALGNSAYKKGRD